MKFSTILSALMAFFFGQDLKWGRESEFCRTEDMIRSRMQNEEESTVSVVYAAPRGNRLVGVGVSKYPLWAPEWSFRMVRSLLCYYSASAWFWNAPAAGEVERLEVYFDTTKGVRCPYAFKVKLCYKLKVMSKKPGKPSISSLVNAAYRLISCVQCKFQKLLPSISGIKKREGKPASDPNYILRDHQFLMSAVMR